MANPASLIPDAFNGEESTAFLNVVKTDIKDGTV